MEEHTEQKRVMADTYMEEVWEQQAVKNWSKPMHNFGVRQNAFNQSADQRIRTLESENLQLRTQIRTLMQQTEELSQIAKRQKERLRQEEQRNREIFGRVAANSKSSVIHWAISSKEGRTVFDNASGSITFSGSRMTGTGP